MKKTKLLAIPMLAAMVFAGCSSAPVATNKAPTVVGVKDIECMVNSTVDFLDGVAALDAEDGDITPKLQITVSPGVEVKDGYATFTQTGSYTVNYTVKDSQGRTAQKKAYVDVLDRETYKTFNIPEGFTAAAYGSAEISECGMKNGSFKLSATGGEIAEDVILTRYFPVNEAYYPEGGAYNYRYEINSDKAGKIKVVANGDDCAEMNLQTGDNVLQFSYAPVADEKGKFDDVKIDVCFGGLGEMNVVIKSVETEFPQEAGKEIVRAENFNFKNRLEARIDTKAGYSEKELDANPSLNNGLEGNKWDADDGNEAHFEISKPSTVDGTAWAGGMFVNTGIELKNGSTYNISLNVDTIHPQDWPQGQEEIFEIQFLYKQWSDDSEVIGKIFHETGDLERSYTIDSNHTGSLWIYVMSGTQKNEIVLKNLNVVEVLGPTAKEVYPLEDFTQAGGTLTTEGGGFTFDVETFSKTDNQTMVTGPSFMVTGSSANYVLTFKARASAPIDMVVAVPVANGWDPSILWQKVKLSEEWTVYTFICNGDDNDNSHKVVWQFGSEANTQYSGVKIEIADLRICLKNGQLDN